MEPMDAFAHARMNAKPDCPKCGGAGSYMYDHNHRTICDLCCRHDRGWWQLGEVHGVKAGKWCCRAGCGKVVGEQPDD